LNHWWREYFKEILNRVKKCYTTVWWAYNEVYERLDLPVNSIQNNALHSPLWDEVYEKELQVPSSNTSSA